MGFLDALFGGQTSAATQAATQAAVKGLRGANTTANNALTSTTNQANQAVTTGADAAGTALAHGINSGIDALKTYGGQAQDAVNNGVQNGVNTVVGSNTNFAPYAATGQNANTLLADSYGVNGAAGNTAAQSAFQASPGYQWQVDQATDAAARKAASLGMANSGGTLDAIVRLSSNLANGAYNDWRTGLSGLSNSGLTAASGIAGNNATAGAFQNASGGTLAQLIANLGQNTATLNAAQGSGQATIDSNLGTSLSSNYGNLGRGISGNNLTTANEVANAQIGAGKASDAATNASNTALSNLLMGTPSSTSGSSGIFGSLLSGLKL